MPGRLAFAIPGDLETRTGGYLYDRMVAEGLARAGWQVDIVNLGHSFPDPTAADMRDALARLAALPADTVLLVDGLAFGALETEGIARLTALVCALVHHPLALETGVDPARAAALEKLERANLALARQIVVTSPHTAEMLTGRFGVPAGKITIALPGTERPSIPRRRRTPPRILAVGSLTARKGHDVLLDALGLIRNLDWTAEIVGGALDPEVSDSLHAQCARLGLAERVRFTGELDRPALQERYAEATIFALATRYEGYGMVFAEALANGLPVVSCDAGAVPDTVPAAASILTPPDNPAAFAEALRTLLTDPAALTRLEAGAAAAAESLPTWEDAVARIDSVLQKMTGG